MELQHFSHKHALLFFENQSHESDQMKAYCSGCGELVSGPSFSCVECGFYLDKMCGEAPSEINHPFHRNHNLKLLVSSPYTSGRFICDFCDERCDKFVYHCSCNLDFHIKCALFSYSIAEKRFGELECVPKKDQSVSMENLHEELIHAKCFACWKPLLDSPYLPLDSGFCLHKKCVDLPPEVNHRWHSQHPLILQFNSKRLPCQVCHKAQYRGFVYCCLPCEFTLHIPCAELPTKINHLCHRDHPLLLQFKPESRPCKICQETNGQGPVYCCSKCKFDLDVKCASPAPTIKGEIHEHIFNLFWRQVPFICDACGETGDYVSYICSACSLIIHKKCISLPRIITLPTHRHHPLSHTFIFGQHEIKTWECKICHKEVNARHGGYCCSDCNYIAHAICANEDYSWYEFDEETDEEVDTPAFSVIEATKQEEDLIIYTKIKHLSHEHDLVLSNDVKGNKFCDGCMLSISTSFYYCLKCDFFLHKSCAKLHKKMYIWDHLHQNPHILIFDCIFSCISCSYEFNAAFSYECRVCKQHTCLRCAQIYDTYKFQGHDHSLSLYPKYEGLCNCCGKKLSSGYACEECNFLVDYECLMLPNKILHKCDAHHLMLTYHDRNVYSEYRYCDICEERRTPNLWFYRCVICDTSAHPKCVAVKYSYMKLGRTYTKGHHPHPLTFIQKVYDYSQCHICHKPCQDLALECAKNDCNYIVHWECIKPEDSELRKGILIN